MGEIITSPSFPSLLSTPNPSLSQKRTIWVERPLKRHLVQLLCNEQRHLQLDQIAQSPLQPDLKCLQGWRIHHLSGQLVPVPHYPFHKKTSLLHQVLVSPLLFWNHSPLSCHSGHCLRICPLSYSPRFNIERPISSLPEALSFPGWTALTASLPL